MLMNLKLPKNLLPVILGALALILWGHNSYKFVKGIKTADVQNPAKSPLLATNTIPTMVADKKNDNWVYESKFRDPFENRLFEKRSVKKRTQQKNSLAKKVSAPAVQFPKLRLRGVIADPNGSLAVIEDARQHVFFAHEGDSISGVKIVRVDSTRIACEYQKQKFTLVLK